MSRKVYKNGLQFNSSEYLAEEVATVWGDLSDALFQKQYKFIKSIPGAPHGCH